MVSPYELGKGTATVSDWSVLEAVWERGFNDLLRATGTTVRSARGAGAGGVGAGGGTAGYVGSAAVGGSMDGAVPYPVLVSESLYHVQPQREKCVPRSRLLA